MKRVLDVLLSALALLLLSPLLLGLAAAVRFALGSPILFRQSRPGLHGHPFTLYKFRSLLDDPTGTRPDQERLTRFGALLRRTSLDELPELWNVLRGDMSLVGPRPLLMEYLPLYTAEQARRHASPRPHRLGPGQRPQRDLLGGEVPARPVVRGAPEPLAGPPHHRADPATRDRGGKGSASRGRLQRPPSAAAAPGKPVGAAIPPRSAP